MTKQNKKLPTGTKFLLAVAILYAVVFSFEPQFAAGAFAKFLDAFWKVLPILFFVFFVMFLVNYFLKPEVVKRHLGHDSGLKGWLYATFGSIAISGPPYVLFPLLGELKKHGMKYSLITVFVNNRNVQPAFIPVIAYYFGWKFAIVFGVYVLLFSIVSGLIMGRLMKEKKIF